jgi:hypothetical protein
VSIPGKDASLVVVALDDDSERSIMLANIMIYTLLTS